MYQIKKTELQDMLNERERRSFRQRSLAESYRCPMVSASMNIAGDIKASPGIEFVFKRSLEIFEQRLGIAGEACRCFEAGPDDRVESADLFEPEYDCPGNGLNTHSAAGPETDSAAGSETDPAAGPETDSAAGSETDPAAGSDTDLTAAPGTDPDIKPKFRLLHKEVSFGPCGPHALYVFDADAKLLKEATVAVEEGPGLWPCGRLLDFDVIGADLVKLARPRQRRCIVCGGPVSVCSRSRAHGLEAIKTASDKMLTGYMAPYFAKAACESLKEEALLTPKPGLVDACNNGAHKDMDLQMFLDSADALEEHFERFFLIGAEKDDSAARTENGSRTVRALDDGCISKLISEGIRAEESMFKATGGVNTHRGAVFSMALMLAALGGYMMRGEDLKERIRALARQKQSIGLPEGTNTHRGGAALGDALNAFPLAFLAAEQPVCSPYRALCLIMSELTDSNLVYRGGKSALEFVQNRASEILVLPDEQIPEALGQMDAECIRMGISPGGAADTLVLALFIKRVRAYDQDV